MILVLTTLYPQTPQNSVMDQDSDSSWLDTEAHAVASVRQTSDWGPCEKHSFSDAALRSPIFTDVVAFASFLSLLLMNN